MQLCWHRYPMGEYSSQKALQLTFLDLCQPYYKSMVQIHVDPCRWIRPVSGCGTLHCWSYLSPGPNLLFPYRCPFSSLCCSVQNSPSLAHAAPYAGVHGPAQDFLPLLEITIPLQTALWHFCSGLHWYCMDYVMWKLSRIVPRVLLYRCWNVMDERWEKANNHIILMWCSNSF